MQSTPQLYSDIELTSEISTASDHRLIQLLLDKCLQHIRLSKIYIVEKDITKKYHAINKAKDIVVYLRSCLNFENENAKELADLLDSLYQFLEISMLKAALKNDVTYLEQAEAVLFNIKSGWDGIAP